MNTLSIFVVCCLVVLGCTVHTTVALESTIDYHGLLLLGGSEYPPSPPGPFVPPPGYPKPMPRGILDLGLPPRQRWHKIVDDVIQQHGWDGSFGQVTKYWDALVPMGIRDTVLAVAKLAERTFDEDDQEFMEEMRGSVDRANMYKPEGADPMSAPECLFMNILYELSAGCTSILASDDEGTIWHGRTLDWPMPPSIRFSNITYLLDVINSTQGDDVLYRGVHNVGFVGANTGVRPRAFSVSLDERHLPDPERVIIDNIAHMSQDRASPVTWLLRRALTENTTYMDAVREFSDFTIGAPAYLIAGGVKYPHGLVVTRNWNTTEYPWYLGDGPQPWYLVQTNYDHWNPVPPRDNRRGLAEGALNVLGKAGMSLKGMLSVLHTEGTNETRGVLNGDTMFTVVMNANRDIIESWLWQ